MKQSFNRELVTTEKNIGARKRERERYTEKESEMKKGREGRHHAVQTEASCFCSSSSQGSFRQLHPAPPPAPPFWTWLIWTGSPWPLALCRAHSVCHAAWGSTRVDSRSVEILRWSRLRASRCLEGPRPMCACSWKATCQTLQWSRSHAAAGSAGWTWCPWVKSGWAWAHLAGWRSLSPLPAHAPDNAQSSLGPDTRL